MFSEQFRNNGDRSSLFRKSSDVFMSIFRRENPSSLAALRENLFDWIVFFWLVLGIVPLMGATIKSIQYERWNTLVFLLVSYLAVAFVALLRKRWSFRLRVSIGLILLYFHSVIILVRFGLSGSGAWTFLLLSLLATVFLGIKSGVWFSALSTVTIAVVGLGMSTGWIPFDTQVGLNSISYVSWFQAVVLYFMFTCFMVFGPGMIMHRLGKSLKEERLYSKALEQTNEKLRQEIEAREKAENEKKELENQFRQSQKMESVGRLAGGIAHDFNNLLTGIVGNVALARMDVDTKDPLFESLVEIDKAAKRATDLTGQLLAFSRKQIIQPKAINLNELIENMRKMLARIIGEDIDLRTLPMKDLSQVQADQGQIEQIIVNMAVNARDAMEMGGELMIETADVKLDEEYCSRHPNVRPGKYVMLAISDSGKGIEENALENIFDPFFTTKPEGEGTGLGLSTVYGIVQQHGGCIEVLTETGKGTCFKVYLPLHKEKAQPLMKKKLSEDMPGGDETVMIVEDDGMVRGIAIKILTRLGYGVKSASNGAEALAMLEENDKPIDLLLTDVVMPKMNGRELAKEVYKKYPEIKVLFASGYTKDVIAKKGIIDENLQLILKPYSPSVLAVKVREILDC